MPKILIADDHAILREGLKTILREGLEHAVFGEAQSGREALALFERQHWDIVLLDVTLPELNGLEVLKIIRSRDRKARILIVSVHPESLYAKRALRMGACGYLAKESAPEELVRAVQRILSGGRYVSSALAEILARELDRGSDGLPHEALSHREYEVMRRIAAGQPPQQIAGELGLSPKTVSTYRFRVLEKLRLKSNAELVRYCLTHGLVG